MGVPKISNNSSGNASNNSNTLSLLARSLPPPTFLQMRGVGLDISHRSIRAIDVVETAHGIDLAYFVERKIPAGSFYGEEVQTNAELKKALIDLKKEFKLKFVRVSIPEEEGYLFTTKVPLAKREEMRQQIMFQLEENVPIRPEEAVFDFSFIREVKDQAVPMCEVLVSVFPRQNIDNFYSLLTGVGLVPVAFHTGADAIAKAIIPFHHAGTDLIVNIGEKSTGLYIVYKGSVLFTSTLNFGGEALTSVISQQLNVTSDEAMAIKRGDRLLKKKDMADLFFSFIDPLSALKKELSRVHVYWDTHHNQERVEDKMIKTMYICGSDACIHGLDEYLGSVMDIEVKVADIWVNTALKKTGIPPIHMCDSLNYPAALGLALYSVQAIYK